jgi:hypothetical protein
MKTRRAPKNTMHQPTLDLLRRHLPFALYSLATAAIFPEESTNIIWTLRKV